ncbi:MAG: energy-coupling factor transporter transmembrane component T [Hespellia sp.]|nr:energy-coupling factor transporter transmembrane component T [Hespellia sp.]
MYTRKHTIFETLHPALLLAYASGAPILAMLTNHPLFLAISFLAAFCVQTFYSGIRETAKNTLFMLPFVLVVALINLFTNQRGMTILFRAGHYAYTCESLCYGIANGMMLLTVLVWFRSFSAILSNEKFLYLFGRHLPATALLLSMILKLFPETRHKIQSIQFAQGGFSNNPKCGIKERLKHSMRQISSLLEWSMEDSIETADSMKARAYGKAERTSYRSYKMTAKDRRMAAFFAIAFLAVCYSIFGGSGRYTYFPVMRMDHGNILELTVSAVIYLGFLFTPLWMELQLQKGGMRTWESSK